MVVAVDDEPSGLGGLASVLLVDACAGLVAFEEARGFFSGLAIAGEVEGEVVDDLRLRRSFLPSAVLVALPDFLEERVAERRPSFEVEELAASPYTWPKVKGCGSGKIWPGISKSTANNVSIMSRDSEVFLSMVMTSSAASPRAGSSVFSRASHNSPYFFCISSKPKRSERIVVAMTLKEKGSGSGSEEGGNSRIFETNILFRFLEGHVREEWIVIHVLNNSQVYI